MNRRSFPVKASSLEPTGASRPITYPVAHNSAHSSPAVNNRAKQEDEVQQGIERLRAQTTHAALALDSVVEDILKRRTQRLSALEQAGREPAAPQPAAPQPHPNRSPLVATPPPAPYRDQDTGPSRPVNGVNGVNGDSRHLGYNQRYSHPDPPLAAFPPAPGDASPPGFTTPYADRTQAFKPPSADPARPIGPARNILSVAGHPLLYRSPPDEARAPADAEETGRAAEISKEELEEKAAALGTSPGMPVAEPGRRPWGPTAAAPGAPPHCGRRPS